MRVALATCKRLPEPDPDEPLLLAALRARGADAYMAAWDDPAADVSADACVLRSTWNYYHSLDSFLAWAARVPRLHNSFPVVRWNANKRYLDDLARAGVPVVPTVFLIGSVRDALASLRADVGVIKPAVSAASFDTMRVDGNLAEAEAHARKIAERCEVMVQPYVASVEDYGERSVVWIDGAFTHAIRKSPRFGGEHESVSGALPIGDDERALAEAALAAVRGPLLYARIDMARDDRGRPMIMELELIEPSLFLLQSPEALDRFATAIVARTG